MGHGGVGERKAPAAICRKIIEAKRENLQEIEVWGDGRQTRSFTYIDDCIIGIQKIVMGDSSEPVNLGSSELTTINGLVDIVSRIANVDLRSSHDLTAPKGVNGRNSDNTMINRIYDWAPSTTLRDGMAKTYAWIDSEYCRFRSSESSIDQTSTLTAATVN